MKMKELDSKNKPSDIMENAHLLHRYRQELGWTIEKMSQKMEISLTKIQRYTLKGQLKVSELERLCRLWKIPITAFFSQDLLPEGFDQSDIKKIKSEVLEVSEPVADYETKKTDALILEKDNTISLLKSQLERSQKNEDFLQGLLSKQK